MFRKQRIFSLVRIFILIFTFKSSAEIRDEGHLPVSLGMGLSMTNGLGGCMAMDFPLDTSRTISINLGSFHSISDKYKDMILSYEFDFVQHLGTQATDSNWYYYGAGLTFWKPSDKNVSNYGVSLIVGGRSEFGFGNTYIELASLVGGDLAEIMLRAGLRFDDDKLPRIPFIYF